MSLTVIVTIGEQTFLFDSVIGVKLAPYIDPQGAFVQDRAIVRRPDTTLAAIFCVDRVTNRSEVIFTNFNCWTNNDPRIPNITGKGAAAVTNPAVKNLPAYTATFSDGQSVSVPFHCHGARWRYNPTPLPVRTTIAALIASKAVPPYAPLPTPYDWTTLTFANVMSTGPFDPGMPDTGDRGDIGLFNEWEAAAIANPTPEALAGVLRMAEAGATMPDHICDELTSAPLDLTTYPTATVYEPYYQGDPWINLTGSYYQGKPIGNADLNVWQLDAAHFPDSATLAWLLTGDPFYLEELQYQMTWKLLWTTKFDANKVRLIPLAQTREGAWSIRTLGACAKWSPSENCPNWLKPASYWQKMLDANLADWTAKFVNSANPARKTFFTMAGDASGSPWQDDFVATAVGYLVYLGFESWRPFFQWKAKHTYRFCDNVDWPLQWNGPYHVAWGPVGQVAVQTTPGTVESVPDNAPPGFVWFTDTPAQSAWKQAWINYSTDPAMGVTPQSTWPTTGYAPANLADYPLYKRGVLAMGCLIGEPTAHALFGPVDAQIQARGYMTARWNIRPTATE